MERFKKGGIILLIIIMFGCNYNSSDIAPFSDLYIMENPKLTEVNYNTNKRLKYLNIHCTASKGELSKEWLLNFFKNERGWSKPGYNYVVHMDGSIDTLVHINWDGYVSYDEISYGVRGKNSESVNIAYTGGVDNKLRPKDTRTLAQKTALKYLVNRFRCHDPDVIIMGHRDHPNVAKACPSFDVQKEYYDNDSQIVDSYLFDNILDSLEN